MDFAMRLSILSLLAAFLLQGCITATDMLTVKDTILKPRILYHGSQDKNITELEPRAIGIRDASEGRVVFAATDPGLASIFISPTHQYSRSGRFCSTCPYYFVFSDEEKYKNLDKGGSIYFLPIDSFHTSPSKGVGTNEWISKKNVKPLFKMDFDSSLQAMLSFGVQVFFVTNEIFEQIKTSQDHGKSILLNLQSENKKQNKNYFHITNNKNEN
jgi:hypothetical protein